VAGTFNGAQPIQVKSTLFLSWPPRAITFSTVDAETTCALIKQRYEAFGGGMLLSGLSGAVGSETVCMDVEARAGQCRGVIARYYAADGDHEADWTGTVTLSNVASDSVRGEFNLQSDSGQIRGQFDAKPCILTYN
jgi:hypothetical protein